MLCFIHVLKMQGLGNSEEARVRLLGTLYALKKAERKRRLISSVNSRRQLLGSSWPVCKHSVTEQLRTQAVWVVIDRGARRQKKEPQFTLLIGRLAPLMKG